MLTKVISATIIFGSFRAAKGEWTYTPGCARGYSYRALSEPFIIKPGGNFVLKLRMT